MNVLTPSETRAARRRMYMREYTRDRRRRIYGNVHPIHRHFRVRVEYPGCGYPDAMSYAEYLRWKPEDWPPGTRIWVDGKEMP